MINNNVMDIGMGGETGLENTTWWKPDGSDHFTVHEILMSPEGFSIKTTDGRLLQASVMEQYIQSNTPITGHERMQHAPRIDPRQLEGIDKSAIVSDDIETHKKGLGSLRYTHPDTQFKQPFTRRMVKREPDPINDPVNPTGGMGISAEPDFFDELDAVSFGMIDRVLGKANFEDLMTVYVNPVEKIDAGVVTLVNTLNIKRSELKSYMVGRIAEKIGSMVNAAFMTYFDRLLGEEESTETPVESAG